MRLKGSSKLLVHELVLVLVLAGLSGLRILNGTRSIGVDLGLWWLGAIAGFVLVFADNLIYAFWQKPEDVLATKMKDIFGGGRWLKGLASLLGETQRRQESIMRSVLFLGVYIVMGLLAVTSVASPFGRGFMLGLGLHLWMDLVADFVWKKRDIRWWFWQIKREIGEGEIKGVVWGFTILFGVLVWGL